MLIIPGLYIIKIGIKMYHGYQLKFELPIQALDFICFACVSLSDFCLLDYESLKTRKKNLPMLINVGFNMIWNSKLKNNTQVIL